MTKWTKESIQGLLASSDKAVDRACVALYQRQEVVEQQTGATLERNGVGFTAFDAAYLTRCAKGVLQYGSLTPAMRTAARPMLMKYHRQLADIAEQREFLRKQQTLPGVEKAAAAYAAASKGA